MRTTPSRIRAVPVCDLLDAVRYVGAPLDEAQRRDFAVTHRRDIALIVMHGVLRARQASNSDGGGEQ